MTDRLFDRVARLTVQRVRPTATDQKFFLPLPDPIEISQLRLRFTVEKNLKASPNTCEVIATNLSPATRSEIRGALTYVRLEAGYQDSDGPRLLFSGDVTWARSSMVGPTWETRMIVADGARAFANARVSKVYGAGATVIQVLRDAAASMQLTLPKEIETSAELREQFTTSFVFSSKTSDELSRLLAPFGYTWSVQGGRLQILRDEDFLKDSIALISETNGMVGSPDAGKPSTKGKAPPINIKLKLYPELSPGALVQVDSRECTGRFKIQRVRHTGDTKSGDWYTEIEVEPT